MDFLSKIDEETLKSLIDARPTSIPLNEWGLACVNYPNLKIPGSHPIVPQANMVTELLNYEDDGNPSGTSAFLSNCSNLVISTVQLSSERVKFLIGEIAKSFNMKDRDIAKLEDLTANAFKAKFNSEVETFEALKRKK